MNWNSPQTSIALVLALTPMSLSKNFPSLIQAPAAARATAEPHDEPPGIRWRLWLKGLLGVPKKSLMPEGATASSLRFVFPTICTFLAREIRRHAASVFAGGRVWAKYLEPAVVTTPLTSIRSLTARRSCLPSFAGAQ